MTMKPKQHNEQIQNEISFEMQNKSDFYCKIENKKKTHLQISPKVNCMIKI